MPRIKTRNALIEYILRQLGSPTISVHLTEEQLSDCIDRAIEKYSEYAWGGTIDGTLLVTLTPGVNKYILNDSIVAITDLAVSSTSQSLYNMPKGYSIASKTLSLNSIQTMDSFDIQSSLNTLSSISQIEYFYSVKPHYSYNFNKKELVFHENIIADSAIIEIAMDYEPNESGDNIFNNFWIKKRALAEAFLNWSNVVGLYDRELLGGSRINYADLQSKGDKLMDETEEEIYLIATPLLPDVC